MAAEVKTLRILIVGAGVAGSVLALALNRLAAARPNFNVDIILVDSATSFRSVGAGFGLTANAVRPLRQLGVLDELLKVSQRCKWIKMSDEASKKPVFEAKQPDLMYGQPLIVVERAKLQDVILAELSSLGTSVQFGRKLESLSEFTDSESTSSKVKATFADGSVEIVDIVVGADGVRSKVRDHILGEEKVPGDNMPIFTGWSGVVGISDSIPDFGPEQLGEAHWMLPKSGRGGYGCWSLPDNKQFWYILESDTKNARGPGAPIPKYTLDEMKATLDNFSGSWYPGLESFSTIIQNTSPERLVKIPLMQRVYTKIVSDSGSVVLVGDAAHPVTPFLGQGAALGIEDAIVLANALLPRQGEDVKGAHWYAEQRIERIKAIAKQGDSTAKLQMGETIMWRALRWVAFAVVSYIIKKQKPKTEEALEEVNEGRAKAEVNSDVDRGPMAWIHREKYELDV